MYGICHLSNIPVRKEKTSKSELVTQLIYGELYKIVEKNKKWYLIEIHNDKYQGWINYSQFKEITKKEFNNLKINEQKFLKIISTELETKSGTMLIGIGAVISNCNFLNHKLKNNLNQLTSSIKETALKFLNVPYLWGGKTYSGIDCSGFTQLVYKLNKIKINRDAYQQAEQGKAIDLVNAKEGDLAFFGNKEITHVGIILKNQKIIHAFGKVRIDVLNKKGILNLDSNSISHKLIKVCTY